MPSKTFRIQVYPSPCLKFTVSSLNRCVSNSDVFCFLWGSSPPPHTSPDDRPAARCQREFTICPTSAARTHFACHFGPKQGWRSVLEHPFFWAPKKTPGENVGCWRGRLVGGNFRQKLNCAFCFVWRLALKGNAACSKKPMDFSATHVFGDAPKRKEKIHTPKFSENKNWNWLSNKKTKISTNVFFPKKSDNVQLFVM